MLSSSLACLFEDPMTIPSTLATLFKPPTNPIVLQTCTRPSGEPKLREPITPLTDAFAAQTVDDDSRCTQDSQMLAYVRRCERLDTPSTDDDPSAEDEAVLLALDETFDGLDACESKNSAIIDNPILYFESPRKVKPEPHINIRSVLPARLRPATRTTDVNLAAFSNDLYEDPPSPIFPQKFNRKIDFCKEEFVEADENLPTSINEAVSRGENGDEFGESAIKNSPALADDNPSNFADFVAPSKLCHTQSKQSLPLPKFSLTPPNLNCPPRMLKVTPSRPTDVPFKPISASTTPSELQATIVADAYKSPTRLTFAERIRHRLQTTGEPRDPTHGPETALVRSVRVLRENLLADALAANAKDSAAVGPFYGLPESVERLFAVNRRIHSLYGCDCIFPLELPLLPPPPPPPAFTVLLTLLTLS